MAENEIVLEDEVQPENVQPQNAGPSKGQKILAGIKEWGRKKVVALKRKPQTIALVVLAITSIYFLLALVKYSQAVNVSFADSRTPATGICTFVITLLSLLSLVSFLNSFPKRKKPNIFFIVLVFAMIAGMVACDVVVMVQMGNFLKFNDPAKFPEVVKVKPYIIAHIVLLGVSAIVFALLPVYKKLINKIDTSVKLESATENMHGEIDIQED